ncbi:MAG: efflux RND transporter periplasmic adaptor subunit [Gammaproteobacteria bacterium]|jgi:HlyD family secretion protein|nr:efflux RND transporter periplasmic adaptor subunit [Gammaproteobacteria bacterium]MBT3723768.1 efflux RND transporter periplasmic adaptor subunit [Gammaproteobacteria bacterium]MBT4075777.1 efflux RND transporter periplasmic adaptor subunit [Gammaproteobacteria bacterium]MBT4196438.1 efflux RND transporter periplasmic adaptor subunit [Gammaproteobacteria bacterium]MBT4448141.1 efflux RND transporter periplasmic adaptor subunit [Gammaproteobacteria bacterium]
MSTFKTLVVVVLSATVVVSAVYWAQRNKPIPVTLTTVESGEIERTVTNTRAGTLNACRRARLSPSLGGQISSLPVKEGEKVKKGQVLFEIWNNDLLAQTQLAQSEFTASKALQQQACIQFELAEREATRMTKLLARGLVSDEIADKAVGQSQASKAACDAAIATVSISQAKILVARAALERSRLIAPFDGTIAEVNGELGEYITPSPVGIPTPPAVDIIDNSCLYVSAPIDEVDAPEIRAGMIARISLDAFGKQFFDGRVRRVAPYVLDKEKQARTVDIEVDFITDKDNSNMLPGYTADVEVIIDSHSNSLRIPTEALLEGNKVYLFDPDFDTITEVEVTIGLSNWKHSEVLTGLEQGQQIVTSIDRDGLMDGAVVKTEKVLK